MTCNTLCNFHYNHTAILYSVYNSDSGSVQFFPKWLAARNSMLQEIVCCKKQHGFTAHSTNYWRASEASETLSGLFNRESYIYYYIYIMVRANFVLITRKEGGA